jgi:CRP-like cAMP-binding protein
MSDEIKRIGILQKGKAHISCIDSEGVINIAERLTDGSVFGEIFTMSDNNLLFILEADTDCTVRYIEYERIVRPCENNCANHCTLLNNLFHMAACKSRNLSVHINILSRRTTRQKLLTYFDTVSDGANDFEIPLSFTDLADYICSDRSAMMREIKNMKGEGVLILDGRKGKVVS